MNSNRTCFVHIGTHKTGTTSIQRMLAANARFLLNHGLHVPGTGRPVGYDGQHNIAWELNDDPRFDASRGTLSGLAHEMATVGAPSVCVSSEDFEYLHAKPKRLQYIFDTFSSIGYTSKIIVYLRPHVEYERSLYTELVKHGITETAEEFHALIVRDQFFRCHDSWIFQFAYDRLIAPFADVFGSNDMVIRGYHSAQPDSYLMTDFLNIVLCSDGDVNLTELELPPRMNRSDPA